MSPVILYGPNGLPLTCEFCGQPANGGYLNTLGRNVTCCADHNPFKLTEATR